MNKENLKIQLYKAFLALETEKECKAFLRDLMTEQEIGTFTERFEVARLLYEDKNSYRDISKNTGVSTTTITRINNWLERGKNGYKSVLAKFHSHHNPVSTSL